MTDKEALKLALKALETNNNKAWKSLVDSGDAGWWEAEEQPFYEVSVKAITALRQAIAEAEQVQPVGEVLNERGEVDWISFVPAVGTSLYTAPPPRQPLTDEQDAARYRWLRDNNASFIWHPARYNADVVSGFSAFGTGYLGFNFEEAVDRAIEEKLKEKNT